MTEPQHSPPDDLVTLSLFPLNMVLFPGMVVPLHIFEERYKKMIGDCVDREEPFGIVLIREGKEVGDPAEPFQIGTSANIVRVERLVEGRMNILTRGCQRFETSEIVQHRPHLVGRVRHLEEQAGEIAPEMVSEVSGEYANVLRKLATLGGRWSANVDVPQDPITLSYGIASNLELPRHALQELLELPTAGVRLQRLLPFLKQANEALEEELVKRNPFQGPRLN